MVALHSKKTYILASSWPRKWMSIIQLIMFSLWLTLFIQIFVTLSLEWLTEALRWLRN